MGWNNLTLTDKAELMKLYLQNGITSLDAMREHYNSFDKGGRFDAPPFVKRFSEGQKRAISTPDGHATHLLSVATDDNGAVVYPMVQPVDYNDSTSNLRLVDDNNFGALKRAIEHGDTLRFNTEKEALDYTENYKRVPSLGAMLNNPPKLLIDASKGRFFQEGGNVDGPVSIKNRIRLHNGVIHYVNPPYPVEPNAPTFTYYDDNGDWTREWYKHRREQLRNAFGSTNDSLIDTKMAQAIDYSQSVPVRYDYLDEGVEGQYDRINKRITVSPYAGKPASTILHEQTHALTHFLDNPKDAAINPILNTVIQLPANYHGETYQGYLLEPTEIYARLMQFRKDNKLNPLNRYNKSDIKRWRDSGLLRKYQLDYSDDILLRWLNDVADNSTNNTPVNIAAKGGHLYQEGGDTDETDEPIYIPKEASETGWMPEVQITEDRPAWQQGLTDYDWSRARQYYSNSDGTLNAKGMEFIRNVASKRRISKSSLIKDPLWRISFPYTDKELSFIEGLNVIRGKDPNYMTRRHSKDEVEAYRRRLYESANPRNYELEEGDLNTICKKIEDMFFIMHSKNPVPFRGEEREPVRDEFFRLYLGIPEEESHFPETNKLLTPTDERPSTSHSNIPYYRYNGITDEQDLINLYQYASENNIGTLGKSGFNRSFTRKDLDLLKDRGIISEQTVKDLDPFNKFTLGYGIDSNNQEYISLYDKWDLNPLTVRPNVSRGIEASLEDLSGGIGNPFAVYQRIYKK